MSVIHDAASQMGRKKLVQGKRRSDAVPSDHSLTTSNPEAAKDGELPKGWSRVAIKDMTDSIQYGHTASAIDRKDGPRFLRITDIQDGRVDWNAVPSCNIPEADIGKYRLSSGDLVFARTGATTGKSFLIGDCPEAVFASYLIRVRVSARVDSRYLSAFFQSPDYWRQIEGGKRGSGQPNVNAQVLGEVQFPIAPLPEQRRIAAEIEKQFTRIAVAVEALRRVQANLKRYRAAVLKAACEGRLVPIDAELRHAEDQGQKSKTRYETGDDLLARILTERRQNWLGRGKYKEPTAPSPGNIAANLPEGWCYASVDQIVENSDGRRVPLKLADRDLRPGQYPYYGASGVIDDIDSFLFDGDYLLIAEDGANLLSRSTPIAFRATGKFWVNNHAHIVQMRGGMPLAYLSIFLNGKDISFSVTGSAQPKLTQAALNKIPVPLPPLAEQTRIVAEVERRLSVVEELEAVASANLQRATRLRQSILQKAFAGELVAGKSVAYSAIAVELRKAKRAKPLNAHFARALLSAEIVHRLHAEPTFGRIKHQKILHLCEHIAQIGEIDGQYHREAAGPLDSKLIYASEAELKKQKWYREVRRDSYGHAYEPLSKAGGHRKYVEAYWPDKLPVIEKLIELMRDWNTDRCEIFCTTYAAWNDLLLWNKEPTEAAILHEILERWHDRKKRVPKERWQNAVAWIKRKGFVPTGFGKPTMTAG